MLRQVRALALAIVLPALGCLKPEPAPAPEAPAAGKGAGAADSDSASSRVTLSPEGNAATGEAFELRLEAPAELATGGSGEVRVLLKAKPPYHLNAEYPHVFRPSAESTGVVFEGARVDLTADAERSACQAEPKDTCSLSKAIPFKAGPAGTHKLQGVVAFSVCTQEVCLIEKIPLAAAVTIR